MKSRRELQRELDAIRALMYRADLTAEERICAFAVASEAPARGGAVTLDELAEVTGFSVDVVEQALAWCSTWEGDGRWPTPGARRCRGDHRRAPRRDGLSEAAR